MKTFQKISLFVLLLIQICFAQEDYSSSSTKLKHHDPNLHSNFENRYGDKNSYKLRMGDKDIPISTNSGQIPQERQLDIVKNVFIDDFLVNDDVAGGSDQDNPSIAMDDNGNFVIVWEDLRNGSSDIYYQRYNSSGEAQGVSTRVNDVGIENQYYLISSTPPSIAMDESSNFVIVWEDYRNGKSDIYYQRYNNSGEAEGVNTKVNDDDVTGGAHQWLPSIAMNGNGNFVIVWTDRGGNGDIHYQRYNSNGKTQGVNTKANDNDGTANWSSPSIALDISGNFVIVWEDGRNGKGDIYYQRYNSSGEAQGVNTKANDDDGGAGQGSPSIVMDISGNFVIVWEDGRNGDSDIYFQRYNSSGEAQGANTKANDDDGTTAQCFPVIEMDNSDNFVIVWEDDRNWEDEGNGKSDIYYQRYNKSGVAQGINIKANDADAITSRGIFWVPSCFNSIAMDSIGNFVIVWTGRNGNWDIYYQRYNSSGEAEGVNTKAYDDVGATDQRFPSIAMDGNGNFAIVWMDERNGNYDLYYQRYNSSGEAQGVNTKVNDDDGTAFKWSHSIVMDESGNFVIVWEDYRNGGNYGNNDVYYQLYNNSGEAQGINTKANDDVGGVMKGSPLIVMDERGNFVIVWEDERNGNRDIYFQRYNSRGEAEGVNTKANDDIDTAERWSPSIVMDVSSNFVIVWMDSRNGNDDIYFQQYNNNGEPQGVNAKANDDICVQQGSPSIAMDESGNFVIVWEEWRGGCNYDIYYQRYNSSGVAQGVNTKVNDDDGTTRQESPSIIMDSTGNFVIVWDDERNGNRDIYFQQYNNSGEAQGVNTKANDDDGIAEQESPSIAMDGSGNFVIVWEDHRNGTNKPDIIGQRYFSDGNANCANYRIVADGPNYGEVAPVLAANNESIVFSWMDNRRSKGWDIYAKIVDWDWDGVTSTAELRDVLREGYALFQNYPNPFNPSTTIKYSLDVETFIRLNVFDVLGREVATLVNQRQKPGNYEVEFNCHSGESRNLTSGVYFYQLKVGIYIETKKMILLK